MYKFLTLIFISILFANGALQAKIVVFKWSIVGGAKKYQFQLALNNSFTNIVENIYPKANKTTLDAPLGRCYYRVRAFNYSNQPGIWSKFQSIVIIPTRPIIISPSKKNLLYSPNETVMIKWTKDRSKGDYVVAYTLLVNKKRFKVVTNWYKFTPKSFGNYDLRVRAKTKSGLVSKYSLPVILKVKVSNIQLLSPKKNETINNKNVNFKWRGLASTSSYTILIFKDKKGKKLFRKISTKNNHETIGYIPNGRYYWQVQAIDNQKNITVKSKMQQFEALQSIYF